MSELLKIAREDGRLSNDEISILEQAEIGIVQYEDYLLRAASDDYLSDDERSTLDDLKTRMLTRVQESIDADSSMSEDEMALLTRLLRLIAELADIEDGLEEK